MIARPPNLPTQDCAGEADNAHDLCPHPFPIPFDDTACHLFHEIDIIIQQAALTVLRSHASICVKLKRSDIASRGRRVAHCNIGARGRRSELAERSLARQHRYQKELYPCK